MKTVNHGKAVSSEYSYLLSNPHAKHKQCRNGKAQYEYIVITPDFGKWFLILLEYKALAQYIVHHHQRRQTGIYR